MVSGVMIDVWGDLLQGRRRVLNQGVERAAARIKSHIAQRPEFGDLTPVASMALLASSFC